MKRLIKIGDFPTGINNNICDVEGVLVGHYTICNGKNNTGITTILPHSGNLFKNKVVAGSYVYNGFGKSIGLVQVNELGSIETPIILTNTLSVGKVSDALIDYMLTENSDIGRTTSTINPIILECNDGSINDIQDRVLNFDSLISAIHDARVDFSEGSIGAGCGMKCHGFKGGIGSSSRIINIEGIDYTIGVLVNSNFGSSNGEDLIIKGRHMGPLIKDYNLKKEEDKGSIIVVIATDLPLDSRQLERLCKRAELGISRTGSYAGNGSGDIMVAFSTQNMIKHYTENQVENVIRFSDNFINKAFKAVVDATEEAVLNSMFHADGIRSYNGIYYKSLTEYIDLYKDLLKK